MTGILIPLVQRVVLPFLRNFGKAKIIGMGDITDILAAFSQVYIEISKQSRAEGFRTCSLDREESSSCRAGG